MELTGHVKGLKKGEMFLQKIEDTSLINLDSITIDGVSTFNFKKELDEPEILFIYLKIKDGSFKDVRLPFFAEANEMTINTSLENFIVDARITGSVNQDKIDEHQLIMNRFADKNLELIEQLFKAKQSEEDSLVSILETKQRKLITSRYLATVNFSMTNNNLEVAPYLMTNVIPDINKKYLDTVYQSLVPVIKESKYGKILEELIQSGNSEN